MIRCCTMRIGGLVVDSLCDESKLLKNLHDLHERQSDQTDQSGQSDDVCGLPGCVTQSTHLLKYYIDDKQNGIKQAVFNHGVPSLDVLLASAHYLGLNDCMTCIAKCCAEMKPFCVQQLDEQVAKQVFGCAMVPALTLGWPGMTSLVQLCQVLPSIVRLNLVGMFFNTMVGKVDLLYCRQPCTMMTYADSNWHVERLAFDALVGGHAYKFVININNDNNNKKTTNTKLLKLEMHQTHSLDSLNNRLDVLCVVDSTAMPGLVRNRLLVSPDQQHILWTCMSDKLSLARVYHHATGQLVLRLPNIRQVSWLGPTHLAVWMQNTTAWHCVDLGGKTLFSMPGSQAAGTDTAILSTSSIEVLEQTYTVFWVQQTGQQTHDSWSISLKHEWQVKTAGTRNNTFVCHNLTSNRYYLMSLEDRRIVPTVLQDHTRQSARLVWTNPCTRMTTNS